MEELTKGTSHESLLKWHFGGSFCYQTVRLGKQIPPEHAVSSRSESFVALPLDIDGKRSIVEALDAWVEGERMEGQNQLSCDFLPEIDGKVQKVDGIRRCCIGSLPNTLIFHLKRFALDYTTFQTYKINSYCEFPDVLDMGKYTESYLETKSKRDALQKGKKDTDDKDAAEGDADTDDADAVDCTYKLRGVVIHEGVAGGGHYWSLARDPQGNWVKFNDITVTSFKESDLAEETYGGSYEVTRQAVNQVGMHHHQPLAETRERIRNAYMLYYERVVPVVPDVPSKDDKGEGEAKDEQDQGADANRGARSGEPEAKDDESRRTREEEEQETSRMLERIMRGLRVASDATVGDNKKLHGLRRWAPDVWKENATIQRKRYLFEQTFFEFLRQLASKSVFTGVCDTPSRQDGPTPSHLTQRPVLAGYMWTMLTEVVCRASKIKKLSEWSKALQDLVSGQGNLCASMLAKMADDRLFLYQRLFSRNQSVRMAFAGVISFMIKQLSKKASLDNTPPEVAAGASSFKVAESSDSDDEENSAGLTTLQKYEHNGTGVLPAFLRCLESMQPDVMKNYRIMESYFQIYERLAEAETPWHLRVCAVRSNTIASMVHLYLGRSSKDKFLPDLPTWESNITYPQMGSPDKSPMLRIVQNLLKSANGKAGTTGRAEQRDAKVPDPTDEEGRILIPLRSVTALRQRLLLQEIIEEDPSSLVDLLAHMIRGEQEMTITALDSLLSACKRTRATDVPVFTRLFVAMLSIDDEYQADRLAVVFGGDQNVGGREIKGLVQIASSKARLSKNSKRRSMNSNHDQIYPFGMSGTGRGSKSASTAYNVLKIISNLDKQIPGAKSWLQEHKEAWVKLVNWLNVESYEPTLLGSRVTMLRQKSTEETLLALAETGGCKLEEQKPRVEGAGVTDRHGNATFGWQSIVSGRCTHEGYTDTATTVLRAPAAEDGRILEVRLLMGKIDTKSRAIKSDNYYLQVYEEVPNDMASNMEKGLDESAALRPAPPPGAFPIGTRVECVAPHQQQDKPPDRPYRGFVLGSSVGEQGIVYDIVYENASSENDVPAFLLSECDETMPIDPECRAWRLVSSHRIEGVRVKAEVCTKYNVDIPIKQGQYVGIHCATGCLNLFHRKFWPPNEQEFRYMYTRALTATCNKLGHVEYNTKQDGRSVWGFATTIRYDSAGPMPESTSDGADDLDDDDDNDLSSSTNQLASMSDLNQGYRASSGYDLDDDVDDDDDTDERFPPETRFDDDEYSSMDAMNMGYDNSNGWESKEHHGMD